MNINKPPYVIPPLAEIRAAAGSNGLTVVSTFTGAGGSCLGFEWAGYRVVWSSEFVPLAADVHELNFGGCPVDRRDIRDVEPREILAAVEKGEGEVDVLQGSPPCASFSMAGKRERHWGTQKSYSSTSQRSDDLFFEFARILEGMKPRAFVAENVPGLKAGRARGYLREIHRRLVGCGYRVGIRELDAQWLGVPQRRKRLIFIGLRNDVAPDVKPPYPDPLPYRYSVKDACPWIDRDAAAAGVNAHIYLRARGYFPGADVPLAAPCPTITTGTDDMFVEWGAPIGAFAIGREAAKLRPGGQSDRYFQLLRCDEYDVCPTITVEGGKPSAAGVVDPTGKRKFSIPELRRLCGFPDDFEPSVVTRSSGSDPAEPYPRL